MNQSQTSKDSHETITSHVLYFVERTIDVESRKVTLSSSSTEKGCPSFQSQDTQINIALQNYHCFVVPYYIFVLVNNQSIGL